MTKSKTAAPAASYEAALEELEQLIGRIESGQMPLEEMQAAYQRGEVLMAFCRQRLDTVQDQIKVLDDGALKPFSL
jgi:exodeoxyribonuclease VII small subunit